jgi:PAS domain S-box-containing protein
MVEGTGQARAPLRALVVEDSEDDALLLLRELRREYEVEHHRVQTLGAMEEALAGSWDVVLSDYKMPRFGAPEALALVQEMCPETPFFVVSGKVGEDVAADLMKAGAYDYVMKDNLARLCPAVKRSLQEVEARREKRRAEKKLRASEARLRALFRAMTDVILVYDREGRYLEVAPPDRSLLYKPPAELLGKTVGEVFPEEQAGEFLKHIRRALDTGQSVDFEYGLSIAGRQKWFEATVSPMLGDSVVWVARDVTGRKEAEEELRREEERYRAVIEQATDGIYLLDVETRRVLEANPAFCRMLGYTEGEMRGMEVYAFVAHPPDNVDATIGRTLEQRRRIVGGRKYRRKDGTLVDVEVGVNVIRPGGKEVICTIVRDVTERKRSEERLRTSEAGLANAQRIAHLGNWEWDLVTKEAYWSDELYRIHGLDPQGPPLTWEEFLRCVHPADREYVDRSLREALHERKPYNVEHRIFRPDGSERIVHCQLEATFDESGRAVRAVGTVHDVTERKRGEEALKQSERLYRTVLEQATENICLVDVETGRVVESNPAFRETLGYTEEELHRLVLYDIVAHDRASIEENMRYTLEAGHRFVGQRRYRRKDGSLLDVEVSASTILRDGRETFCVVAHDVSERARTQRLLEERVATLSRIASSLTLGASVEETLRVLAQRILSASTATTYLVLLAGEDGGLRLVASHGVPEGYDEGLQAALRSGVFSPLHEALLTRRPVVFRDAHRVVLNEPLYGPIHRFANDIPEDTIHVLPLVVRGRAIGAITFGYLPDREPAEDEEAFLAAVADQIAVAVENARLFSEARGKAALEERQRLARELHDSVSQALYGIALGARGAHDALEAGEPEEATEPLEYVLSQTRAGLAEMRALIFELRPESLEREGLVAALEKQAAAIAARHQIYVDTTLGAEPDLPPETKEALYRVAREALHNAVKHADASTVRVALEVGEARITLEVSDDGIGFDPRGDFPGHLGLSSMRERALDLGGTLQVQSTPAGGTRVRMWVPL